MAVANRRQDLYMDIALHGTFEATSQKYPAGSIGNDAISSATSDMIAADKVIHQFPLNAELAESSTAVANITKLIHTVNGATATIVGIEATVVTVATGADRTISVDLKKSTAGGAFATVLSATCDFTDASTALTPVAGTVSSASLVQSDLLELVVTVAGAAGNQAKGLLVTVFLREDPA